MNRKVNDGILVEQRVIEGFLHTQIEDSEYFADVLARLIHETVITACEDGNSVDTTLGILDEALEATKINIRSQYKREDVITRQVTLNKVHRDAIRNFVVSFYGFWGYFPQQKS